MIPAAEVKAAYRGSTVLSDDPMVAFIDDVLTPDEIEHIICCAADRIEQAKVSFEDEAAVIEGRSGGNCWLRYDSDPTVRKVGERIAEIVGIPLTHAEAIQVIHYGPGQEYRAHFDSYDLSTAKGQRCCRRGGQRLVTGLVYLNEVISGGATTFPKLGFAVSARPGRLVLFHDTGEDITVPHPGSLHAGTPVKQGEKWAFNIWFHARPMTEIQQFEPAARPPDRAPDAVIANRAEKLWRQAHANVAKTLDLSGLCFSYWDTYSGSQPDLSRRDPNARWVSLIDRSVVNALADKGKLAQLLGRAGLSHLSPPTYERVDQALSGNSPGAVWFVKPSLGTAGIGMYCVSSEQLSGLQLPADCVLQKGIDDPLLDNDRKFTNRIYAMVWNRQVLVFETGITMTHRSPYERGSTDYAIQIGHRAGNGEYAPVLVQPGATNSTFVQHFPAQRDLVGALRPILTDCISASDRDRYQLLGIDTLIRRDGTVQLIEINTYPNFVHSSDVNDAVNVPFFEAVLRTIAGHRDSRLT